MSAIALSASKRFKKGFRLSTEGDEFEEEVEQQEAGNDELQSLFDMIDGYNETGELDGFISVEEGTSFLNMVLEEGHITPGEQDIIMAEAEYFFEDGVMDFEEFKMLVETLEAKQVEEEEAGEGGEGDDGEVDPEQLRGWFNWVDKNQNARGSQGEVNDWLSDVVAEGHMDEFTAKFVTQFISFFSSKTWKGALSFDNFLALVRKWTEEPSDKTIMKWVFCFIDTNNNGFFTEDEVAEFFKMHGLEGEELDGAVQYVGQYVGQDQFMDFKEFRKLWEEWGEESKFDVAKVQRQVAKYRKAVKKSVVASRAKQVRKAIKSIKVVRVQQFKTRKTRSLRKVKATKKTKKSKKQVKRH